MKWLQLSLLAVLFAISSGQEEDPCETVCGQCTVTAEFLTNYCRSNFPRCLESAPDICDYQGPYGQSCDVVGPVCAELDELECDAENVCKFLPPDAPDDNPDDPDDPDGNPDDPDDPDGNPDDPDDPDGNPDDPDDPDGNPDDPDDPDGNPDDPDDPDGNPDDPDDPDGNPDDSDDPDDPDGNPDGPGGGLGGYLDQCNPFTDNIQCQDGFLCIDVSEVCTETGLGYCLPTGNANFCQSCETVSCIALFPDDCPFGVELDYCGCCPRCSKGPGDYCGGPHNYYGSCGEGFTCITENGCSAGICVC